jgi:hypothetical protein
MAGDHDSNLIKPNEHKIPFRVLVKELRVRRPIISTEQNLRKAVPPEDLKVIEDWEESKLEPLAKSGDRQASLGDLRKKLDALVAPPTGTDDPQRPTREYLDCLEPYCAIYDLVDAVDKAHDELEHAKGNLCQEPSLENLLGDDALQNLPAEAKAEITSYRSAIKTAGRDRAKLEPIIKRLAQALKKLQKRNAADNDWVRKLTKEQKRLMAKAMTYYHDVAKYGAATVAVDEANVAVENAERPLKEFLHNAELNALCFSGGGIRSASFSLGVLTELARLSNSHDPHDDVPRGILGSVDYVSTVSGGGYTGSWLTAWIKRHPCGFAGVIREIAGLPPTSVDPEPAPLRHLRDYTSYLAPRAGLFSLDSWTLAAIFLRNLLLNWTILIPLFAAVLLIPLLSAFIFTCLATGDLMGAHRPLLAFAMAGAAWALFYVSRFLPGNYKVQPAKTRFFLNVWLPLLISAWSISAYWLVNYKQHGDSWTNFLHDHFGFFWLICFIAEGSSLAGRIFVTSRQGRDGFARSWRNTWLLVLVAVANSAFVAYLLWLVSTKLGPLLLAETDSFYLFTVVAVPLVWLTFMLAVVVMNGMSAQIDAEENREWWSRSGAVMMIGTAVWLVFHGIVLYSWPIAQAFQVLSGNKVAPTTTVSILATGLGAIASFLGYSPATPANKAKVDTTKLSGIKQFLSKRDLLIPALGTLFFIILAIALANLNTVIIDWIGNILFSDPEDLSNKFWAGSIELAALAAIAFFANWFINVNTFSLHGMYRMRLIRSYMGASNTARKPNPFINFDPADNMAMQDAPKSADAPIHILNMALNMVAGKKLAWQQRKAESFTVSALHSGSYRVGYRPTAKYAGTRGITLGTAMAISGAAASPNMGYHSSPILTLAMALFNARLGWWLPNPGAAGENIYGKNSPRYSVRPLLFESFGRTTDDKPWIYLSDGGHFENLGLYEMVMRRCKTIIVVDGSADSKFTFEDLGNALRKIYIDFGIPIDFDPAVALVPGSQKTNHHCFIGEIKYSCVDEGAMPGKLIYIKASLNGNEPADVTEYYKGHEDFPHEPTSNQFFNEAQFQSYMRLGSHIVHEIVEPPKDEVVKKAPGNGFSMEPFFMTGFANWMAGIFKHQPSAAPPEKPGAQEPEIAMTLGQFYEKAVAHSKWKQSDERTP